MTESQFWELLGLLNWKKLGNDDAVVRPLVKALAKLPVQEIFAFDDHLAAKLHALDTEAHARHMGELSYRGPDQHFSVDEFLYTRCAVVANGKQTFEAILRDPNEFPEDAEFEAILSVAQTAYAQKTGEEYPHVPTPDYETFGNKSGWPSGGTSSTMAEEIISIQEAVRRIRSICELLGPDVVWSIVDSGFELAGNGLNTTITITIEAGLRQDEGD